MSSPSVVTKTAPWHSKELAARLVTERDSLALLQSASFAKQHAAAETLSATSAKRFEKQGSAWGEDDALSFKRQDYIGFAPPPPQFSHDLVPRVVRCDESDSFISVVLEDFGGASLQAEIKRLSPGRFGLEDVLRIGVQLAAAVDITHKAGIVHNDICPASIQLRHAGVDRTVEIQLCNYGQSVVLNSTRGTVSSMRTLEHSQYMSPEFFQDPQVGCSSDLCSVGLVLWELAVGVQPYDALDFVGVAASKLTKSLPSAIETNSMVPLVLSKIIQKLTSKGKQDRYQTAAALLQDLQAAEYRLQEYKRSKGSLCKVSDDEFVEAIKGFDVPASADSPTSKTILAPSRLFGRDSQMQQLFQAFERISSGDSAFEVVFLQGERGNGHTSLFKRLESRVLDTRGRFVSVDVTPDSINRPLHGIALAMEELLISMLCEPSRVLDTWTNKILSSFSPISRWILAQLLPDLQVYLPSLVADCVVHEASEAEVCKCIAAFLQTFSSRSQPLVVYIDDISIPGTTALIEHLSHANINGLLLAGSIFQPQLQTTTSMQLDRLREALANRSTTIALPSLDFGATKMLLKDAITPATGELESLAQLVMGHTRGAPSSVCSLLQSGHLFGFFQTANQEWSWDHAKLATHAASEASLVEYIMSQVEGLQEEAKEFLQLAACHGLAFEISQLDLHFAESGISTTDLVNAAEKSGCIVPLPNSNRELLGDLFKMTRPGSDACQSLPLSVEVACRRYAFRSKAVHDAVLNSMSGQLQHELHLRIARDLQDHLDGVVAMKKQVHKVAGHMLQAIDVLCDQLELAQLVGMLHDMAKSSVSLAQLHPALEMLVQSDTVVQRIGIDVLWASHYGLAVKTNKLRLGILSQLKESDKVRDLYQRLLAHLQPQDIGDFAILAVSSLLGSDSVQDAAFQARDALLRLGIDYPSDEINLKVSLRKSLELLDAVIDKASPEDVLAMPTVTSASDHARTIDTLLRLAHQAARSQGNGLIQQVLSVHGCLNTAKHGLFPSSLFFVSSCQRLWQDGEINAARFRWLANLISTWIRNPKRDQPDDQAYVSIVQDSCSSQAMSNTDSQWTETIESALAVATSNGTVDRAFGLLIEYQHNLLSIGRSLDQIEQFYNRHTALYEQADSVSDSVSATFKSDYIELKNFFAGSTPHLSLDEEPFVQFVRFFGAVVHNSDDSVTRLSGIQQLLDAFAGTWMHVDLLLCRVVLLARQKPLSSWEPVKADVEIIRSMCEIQPERKQMFKYHLARAELAHMKEDVHSAVAHYEECIDLAHKHGFPVFEAWATELQATFWCSQKSKRLARTILASAVQLWTAAGSPQRAQYIQSKYSDVLVSKGGSSFAKTSQRLKLGISVAGTLRRAAVSDDNTNGPESQGVVGDSLASPWVGDDFISPMSARITSTNNTFSFGRGRQADLDLATFLKVAETLSKEQNLTGLVEKILSHLTSSTGATKAFLLLADGELLTISAMCELSEAGQMQQETPALREPPATDRLPMMIVNYVFRVGEAIVLGDALDDPTYRRDPYIEKARPRSILCCPIQHQGATTAIVYLENRLQTSAFTPARIEFVQSLTSSAAVSIENARLTKKNTELTKALEVTKKASESTGGPRYNFGGPIRRVLETLESLKARLGPNDPDIARFDELAKLLTSDGLFSANLNEVNDENGQSLDQDTKSFIEGSLLQQSMNSGRDRLPSNSGIMYQSLSAIGLETIPSVAASLSSLSMLADIPSVRQYNTPTSVTPHADIDLLNQADIDAYLETVCSYDFSVFKLAELTSGKPLSYLCVYVFKRFGLLESLNISPSAAARFFQNLESLYHSLPYHNSTHAADVLQTVIMLILNTDIATKFSVLEIFSLCVGSAVHDVDHPGVNNAFLVQTGHPIAILYNDMAVLESHHASKAFEIVRSPDANIFGNLAVDQMRFCRKLIISIVLATDLSQHFQFINKFKGKIATSSLKLEEEPDRQLVLEMAVKCGDLGNPTKRFDESKRWSFLVMEEFFRQGDREKQLGLPVSKFMDRNDTNIPKW
ncbi:hypothetical protein BC831DRAFT_460229 [Entophlyctis helioformis]|nr:hypothetical protein BC831DRAFT_460229 [Entophlyctis helioformis]